MNTKLNKSIIQVVSVVMVILFAAAPVLAVSGNASFNVINYSYGVRTEGTAQVLAQVASGTFNISFVNNVPHWPQSDYSINIDYEFKDDYDNGVRIEPHAVNSMAYGSSFPLSSIQGLTITKVNFYYQINNNDIKTLSIT